MQLQPIIDLKVEASTIEEKKDKFLLIGSHLSSRLPIPASPFKRKKKVLENTISRNNFNRTVSSRI
jgi:hypothetical protein